MLFGDAIESIDPWITSGEALSEFGPRTEVLVPFGMEFDAGFFPHALKIEGASGEAGL